MSATEKILVPKTNSSVVYIVLLACIAAVFGLMTPLYLQNRAESLYKKYHALAEESVLLEGEVILLEYKINQLSSLSHLQGFADGVGLGLNGVPVKVMGEGGSYEQ